MSYNELLACLIKQCKRCPLAFTTKAPVPFEGDSDIMVVGEAPGEQEETEGRPFIGRSGQLLRNILNLSGIQQPYITNVVKCRPPSNRTPTLAESLVCGNHLLLEIFIKRPRVIICCGKVPIGFLFRHAGLNFDGKVTPTLFMAHPVKFKSVSTVLAPIYHPSYLLRRNSPQWLIDQIVGFLQATCSTKSKI